MSMSAVLIPSGAGIHRAAARICVWLRSEVAAQSPRWRLWAPVAFGGGCGLYFGLRVEPPMWPILALAVLTGSLWLATRRAGYSRRWTLPLLLLACLTLGLATARARTERVAAPIAPALSGPTVIEAWVVDVDSPGERGARVMIAPVRVQGLEPAATPHRLRATLRGAPPPPGASIRLFAILPLHPRPPPRRGPMISAATPGSRAWAGWPSPWGRRARPFWRMPRGGCGWPCG